MNDLDMLTPEARSLSTNIRKIESIEARAPVLNNAIKVLLGMLVVSVVALAVWFWASTSASRAASERQDAVIAIIQDDLKNVCRKTPTESLAPSEKDSCFRAEANIQPSQVTAITQAPSQSFLDNALLLDAVKKRVDDYLATHPTPTANDLLPLIRQVYNDNKPADGKTPTDVELLALVTKVYSANPPTDGKDATQGQADAAIKNYCEGAANPCQGRKGDRGVKGDTVVGPSGEQGPPGRSVVRQYFARNDNNDCRSMTEYSDGAIVDEGPAGDSACPLVETTTEAPPTT